MSFLYKKVLKPLLFLLDAEFVHDIFISFGEFLGRFWVTRAKINFLYGWRPPHGAGARADISKIVDGINYRTPVLLAAGFDYNGRLTRILPCVGFGGEEIGSVTAHPCPGNPKPRLTRLPKAGSIVVNKGLRNDGVEALIARLKKEGARGKTQDFVVGISIARTNEAASADTQGGIEDYAYSFRRLNEEGIGDYYTLNISCPNSFGGEAFATPELLTRLLAKISVIPCKKPVYVKMPLNLPWPKFNDLLKVVDFYKLQGVVIGNLNKDYSALGVYSDHVIHAEALDEYAGGLSGAPCRQLSTDLIRRTRQAYGKRFTIIGVGGIFSAADAREKFAAGADLVQLITGMIYEGPGLVGRIAKSLRDNSK